MSHWEEGNKENCRIVTERQWLWALPTQAGRGNWNSLKVGIVCFLGSIIGLAFIVAEVIAVIMLLHKLCFYSFVHSSMPMSMHSSTYSFIYPCIHSFIHTFILTNSDFFPPLQWLILGKSPAPPFPFSCAFSQSSFLSFLPVRLEHRRCLWAGGGILETERVFFFSCFMNRKLMIIF